MKYSALALALLALSACTDDVRAPLEPDVAAPLLSRGEGGDDDERDSDAPGIVFTLSNQTTGNEVLAFTRAANGRLTQSSSYATGGTGTGGGLGSQGAVVFTRDGRFLLAVNAGSNDISSFRVRPQGLELLDRVASGGMRPISVTSVRGVVYVLNAGGAGNISGFRINNAGRLSPISGSAQSLSSAASGPAQIEFDEWGTRLVVTEKATNIIASYRVDPAGRASSGVFSPSAGQTPFGFTFRNNILLVSEAVGGAPDASVASSYRLRADGSVSVISAAVPTTETAACWFVVTGNGKFGYVSNTGSGTVTGYAVNSAGRLERLDNNGETAVIGAGTSPIDMALSGNSRYLYVLNSGTETISALRVRSNGSLAVLDGGVSGLPNGAVGLAAK